MDSIYRGRPLWVCPSKNFTESQEHLLHQIQEPIMSRIMNRVRDNHLFLLGAKLFNGLVALIAIVLLIWSAVHLFDFSRGLWLVADCKIRCISKNLDQRHITVISSAFTSPHVSFSKSSNSSS